MSAQTPSQQHMKSSIDLLLLTIGSLCTILGGAIVFSDRFFDWMNKHWWNRGLQKDLRSMSLQGIRNFNRYDRGLGLFLGGLLLLAFSLGSDANLLQRLNERCKDFVRFLK
jgi:hypothetical protein